MSDFYQKDQPKAPAFKQTTKIKQTATGRPFWFHLLVVMALCALTYICFFASLAGSPNHGNDTKVPSVAGQQLAQAKASLEKAGFEIMVDSGYEAGKKSFLVLRQSPSAGTIVKSGRTLFLTVNKAEAPLTAMPNLVGVTYRSALLLIKSNRLQVGDTTMRPDIAKGAVLEMLVNGVAVRAGSMIPQSSRIDLVIGDGLGETEMNVPDVTGMPFAEAVAVLNSSGLLYVPVWTGSFEDSSTAVVYKQTPNSINEAGLPTRIREGDFIDIHIKQSASYEEIENTKNEWKRNIDTQRMRSLPPPANPVKPATTSQARPANPTPRPPATPGR